MRHRIRYGGLLIIWGVFLLIGIILMKERSGIKTSEGKFEDVYLSREEVEHPDDVTEYRSECIVLTDSSAENSVEAEEQFRQILKDMRVEADYVDVSQGGIPAFENYKTAVILLSDLSRIQDNIWQLTDWVYDGGRALFALTLQKESYYDMISQKLGITDDTYTNSQVTSMYFEEGFMVGGGQSYQVSDPFNSALAVQVNESVELFAWSGDEKRVPLIWRNAYGEGCFVVDNFGIYEKVVRGIFAASYSLLEDVCVYPVINGSTFYLDDFPSPVPGGDGDYIWRDYQMNISEFYTNVWWPDMMELAAEHGIGYTGVIIENYEDDTSEEVVRALDTQRFQYFGNMLLHMNGELGYHGYNHQPLCLENTHYGDVLPYNTWESRTAIVNAMKELTDFSKEMFPTAELSVYVPPSNVLSPEGREILVEEFPEIKSIASNYFPGSMAYEQEFEVAEDGIVEQPRIISGFILDDYMKMAAFSELNMHYVNSHFAHPDDLLDGDRGAEEGWEQLKSNLSNYMEWLYSSTPNIRNLTGSELAGAIQRYNGLIPHVETQPNQIKVIVENLVDQGYLFLRLNNGTPGEVQGGTLTNLTGNLYLLEAESEEIIIQLEDKG